MDDSSRWSLSRCVAPFLSVIAFTVLLAACRDATESGSSAPAPDPGLLTNSCPGTGNGKFQDEPEVFGAIFESGQRATCSYVVSLTPVSLQGVLHHSYSGTLETDPTFQLAFGWWDPEQAGACRSQDGTVATYQSSGIVTPELHGTGGVLGPPWSGNGGGTEEHCIRPGTFTFSASGPGGSTSFPVDYIQTTGMLSNQTSGVSEWVERPYALQGGVHDLVINADVSGGGGPLLQGATLNAGSDNAVLRAQAVNGSPTDLTLPFNGSTSVSGTANTWFRFSMAGSTWSDDIPSWGHSGGRVLARLFWDAAANPGDATGYYDADAYGPTVIRTHRFPNPVTAQRVYQVALDLKRPSEAPADAPPPAQVTVTINRVYPDLAPQGITPPASAARGASVNVAVTERNLTTTASGDAEAPWQGRLYLSANTTLDASDVLVGSFTESQRISAGGSVTANRLITIPAGQALGSYYVLAALDAGGAVLESNETNNVAASSALLTVTGPDLLAQAATFTPATVAPGGAISVTTSQRNVGSATVPGGWTGKVYLSPDALLATTPNYLVGQYVYGSALAPSTTAAFTLSPAPTVPTSVPAGTYYLLTELDATGLVTELDEGNNTSASTTTVSVQSGLPDLVANNVQGTPSAVAVGDPLTVSVTIRNVGAAPAPGGAVWRIWMSTDQVLDTGTDFLLKVYGVGTIPAGGSKNLAPSVFIPPELGAGTYYVVVELDPANAVAESNEGNNLTASATTVTVGSGPF